MTLKINLLILNVWTAILIFASFYVLFNALTFGVYFVVENFTSNASLQVEVSEFLALTITFILLMFNKLLKINIAFELKTDYILLTLIAAIGIRVSLDPIFRFENIINNAELPSLSESNFLLTPSFILGVLSTLILKPIVEEVIFRGIILKGLLVKYSSAIAILISSMLFSIYHMSITNSIPTFLFSIVACLIYVKTQKLTYSILLHVFSNSLWLFLSIYTKEYWNVQGLLDYGIIYWAIVLGAIVLTSTIVLKSFKSS